MKKTLTLFTAVVVSASLALTAPVAVSAADYANVVLNGKAVSYSDPLARPQIINSRTMVPFRDFAETLGIVIDYQEATKAMTFNQNGMSFSHVAGTATTTVNGAVKSYDTPSMTINGYTMMPITMLLDAVNATNSWNDATKTVNITTKATEPPIVRNVTASSTSVRQDELITLYVTTNLSATQVKVQSSTGAVMTQVTESAADSTGRFFTASFFPPTAGSQLFTIYGGNESGFSSSFSAIGIAVEEPVQLEIYNTTLEDSTVDEGDEVVVKIQTSTDVVRVEVENEDGDVVDSATKPTSEGAVNEWELSFDADDVDGNVDYDVYVFNADGKYGSSYFRVNVNGDGSSSSSDPQITDWDYDVDSDETVTMTVETNRQVDSVAIFDEDGDDGERLDRDTSSSNGSSSRYEWDLEFDATDDGDTYYIYAYGDDDSDYDREKITIDYDGGSSSGSAPEFVRVYVDNERVYDGDSVVINEGDDIDVTVRTNKAVEYIELYYNDIDDDELLDDLSNYDSAGSDYYEWEFTIDDRDIEENERYYIYIYNDDDDDENFWFEFEFD